MKVREVECKSVLSDTKLYGLDYSINPYTGCQHACAYCYAVFMKKFTDHEEEWGSFVDVKANAPEVLRQEVKNKETGSVLLSSVTDPYQPLEEKYEITREILNILQENGFSVSILTKNDLILRDLDILKEFDHGKLSVGLTVNFLKEEDRKIWEPGAPSIDKRLEAIENLYRENIPTYLHVGPWLEGITDLEEIMGKVENNVYELEVENLNRRRSKLIKNIVRKNYPDLQERYNEILGAESEHSKRLKTEVDEIRKKFTVPVKVYID